jgi:CheY-like chemotaxis protein
MKTILLVEDDYLDTVNAQRVLSKLNSNHTLYNAYNGKEALSMLRGESGVTKMDSMPDIILLDLNMPKMNGIEFLRELRSDEKLRHIPVFITTTSNEEYDRFATQELGVSGYIVKPLNFDNKGNPVSSMDTFNLMIDLLRG